VTRTAPGVAAVVTALLLGVTGCGNDAGATVGTVETPAAKSSGAAVQKSPKGALAGLVVLPRGFVADPRSAAGPFTATTFLANWSAVPAVDRALLLNAGFVDGYRASRVSADKKKHFTVQLFKAASPAKAKTLQQGFWDQDTHEHSFGVPGALSDAQVRYDGGTGQSEAIAEVSFVVNTLVVQLSVRQASALGTNPTPDTALLKAIAKEQRARLTTSKS
jgi:hypothetical protein